MSSLTKRKTGEILRRQIAKNSDLFFPLRISDLADEKVDSTDNGSRFDARLLLTWKDKTVPFLLDITSRLTPMTLRQTLLDLKDRAPAVDRQEYPMILTTYLSDRLAQKLREQPVSAIDVNGNYLIQTPELVGVRLDQKNRFPSSRGIKNVFKGNSSIVGRFLLLEDRPYTQVQEVHEGIEARGGGISYSTVSKVLTALDEELIIHKTRDEIKLLQPDKLLTRLTEEYQPPKVERALRLKLPENRREQKETLDRLLDQGTWIWSGETSAERYATTTSLQTVNVYARRLPTEHEELDAYRNERFFNCELLETADDFVYFDRNGPWASPIETYLNLAQLDKREQEIAQDIRTDILRPFT